LIFGNLSGALRKSLETIQKLDSGKKYRLDFCIFTIIAMLKMSKIAIPTAKPFIPVIPKKLIKNAVMSKSTAIPVQR
jgi:hypothetical protein